MGEVTKEDIRRLREELRETRELAAAVLMATVGKDRMWPWRIEAAIEHRNHKEQAGPRLREVIGGETAERIWDEFEVAAVRGLRRLKRDEVEALRGVGPVTMGKLDAALEAEGAAWGDWV